MIMLVSSLEYESGTTASWIGRNRFKNQGVWNMYFGAVYWATGCLKGQETRVNAGRGRHRRRGIQGRSGLVGRREWGPQHGRRSARHSAQLASHESGLGIDAVRGAFPSPA